MGHLPLLCRESPLITAERNGPLPFPLLLSRAERLLTIAVQHALSHRNIQPAFLAGEQTVSRLKKYSSEEKSSWLLDTYQVSQTFEFKGAVLEYYTLK